MSNTNIKIPQDIYTSDKACGEFIISINERLSKLAELEKQLKFMKEEAVNVMLTRLEATGQKHFAFDFGTFYKTSSLKISYPSADNGGKEAGVQWLIECLKKGVITAEQLLDVQQSRLNSEPILAIEKAVEEYNQTQILNGQTDLISPSPFNKFEHISLATPRKFKN